MPRKKGAPLTEKEKERIALQKATNGKFLSKKQAVEIIKDKDRKESQHTSKQIETIQGIVNNEVLTSIRNKAQNALNKATDKLDQIASTSNNHYVVIHATNALIKIVEITTPTTTLQREESTKKFSLDIKPDQIQLCDLPLNEYKESNGQD